MKPPSLREPSTRPNLAVKQIRGHLTYARGGQVTAWYLLPAQPWAFRSDAQRLSLVMGAAQRYAVLAGRTLHGRVTSRPYPVRKWVEALDRNTLAPVGGKETDSPWERSLVRVQEHLKATTLADKEVYLGVEVGRLSQREVLAAKVLRREIDSEDERIADDVTVISEIVAGPGLEGRACTPQEMEWLMRRSIGLHLPAPAALSPVEGDWDEEDLHTFTDSVDVHPAPFGRTTRVVSAEGVERHVAVLSLGRTESVEAAPQARDPWMSHVDRLPFPVEWSFIVPVTPGPEASAGAQHRLLVGRDMQKHYAQHGLDVPLDVGRKIDTARVIVDEMLTAPEVIANRAYGWYRLAVAGRTEKECLQRVRQVREAYRPLRMSIEHPKGQEGLLREFIPGEGLSTTAHKRRFPVRYFAAGMPTISSSLGDRRGFYRGYTCGTSRRPVMFDPHFGPEVREKSGLCPLVGGLGSGKSTAMGAMCWDEFEAGVPTTIWDPSGPLSALVALAHRVHGAHTARHLDLMRAEEGRLSPFAIIPEPRREHFRSEDAWRAAQASAAAERKTLALDVCRMLTSHVGEQAHTRKVLTDAIRNVGGGRTSSIQNVVDALRRLDDPHGGAVADLLMDAREHPQTRLYFGAGYQHGEEAEATGLSVITMAGVPKPDLSIAREDWTTEEMLALPLLSLAIYYTSRRIYDGPMRSRKCIGLDEAHFLADWPSGRALLQRLATDSRKWNAAVFPASQNAGHVLSLNVANLIGTAFVGRTEDEGHAREALRLLRVPTGAGYEGVLAGLSPIDPRTQTRSGFREFVMLDVDGMVDKMRFDLGHNPDLLATLDTTANPHDLAVAA